MADRPTAPDGEFILKDVIYAEDGIYESMTDSEFVQGRNNTGEVETPLGSVPNAHKDNWLFNYFNKHIVYLTQMVEYLESEIKG
jgi:hypothetical protein